MLCLVWEYVHECRGLQQPSASDPLELAGVTGSCELPDIVLRIVLQSSGRAV